MSELAKHPGQRETRETLTLRFDGESVVDGTISARAMGVALEGVADLVQALSSVGEFKAHGAPEARVVATEEGSFLMELDLVALGEWWASTRGLLTSQDVSAAVNLLAFMGLFGGVFKWFQKHGGKKIVATESAPDGTVEVVTEDNQREILTAEVAEAVSAPRVQGAARQVVEPLTFLGIDTLTINAETVNVTITNEQAASFPEPRPEPDPNRQPETIELWASFTRPDFDGEKWGISTTRGDFQVVIEDRAFLARVDDGSVSLSKYDEFRVTLRLDPYLTAGGQRRFHRYVTKVHDQRGGHDHGAEALPDEAGEGEL